MPKDLHLRVIRDSAVLAEIPLGERIPTLEFDPTGATVYLTAPKVAGDSVAPEAEGSSEPQPYVLGEIHDLCDKKHRSQSALDKCIAKNS